MRTVGYKAMNMDMTCRGGYQFEVGKTYTVDNDKPLEICSDSGFHFCLNLENVFNFYDYNNCRLFEIETDSEVLTEGNKSITKKIKINRELTQEDLNKETFKNTLYTVYFKKMTDEELLKFKDDADYEVREIVVDKMEDLDLMCNTFKNDTRYSVRVKVVEKMKDLDLMFNTFKNERNKIVRQAVVERMEDLDLMFKTFKDDEDWEVRSAVVLKMEDLGLMFKTFKNDKHYLVRKDVAERMEDKNLMFNTFKDDESWFVRLVVTHLQKK